MDYGLPKEAVEQIRSVFSGYSRIEEAILYGSRAKETARKGSDIDLVLKGRDLDLRMLNQICLELDELLLPYRIDLSLFSSIENSDLIDHINRVGKIFYKSKRGRGLYN